MFRIEWKEGAIRQLEKLDSFLLKRICKKIEELKQNPFSMDIKKLKGIDSFRLRIGNYRVILDINPQNNLISILRIGHRKNIYDR